MAPSSLDDPTTGDRRRAARPVDGTARGIGRGARPTSSSAAEVTPPQLQHDSGVAYPEQALRDGIHDTVTVVLFVDVDANGTVSSATVEVPQGHGFDEAAIAAAKSLVFDPARRGGRPIAARSRFRYLFEPPPPRLTGRVLRQASDAPVAGATVTVRDASATDRVVTTAADGSFTLEKLTQVWRASWRAHRSSRR
jgi:TonB family protein